MNDLAPIVGKDLHELTERDAALRSKVRFVRSVDHLAVARARDAGRGRTMTAWEALDAYGPESLVDAYEKGTAMLPRSPGVLAATITSRREELGISVRVLAQAAGVSETLIRDAES